MIFVMKKNTTRGTLILESVLFRFDQPISALSSKLSASSLKQISLHLFIEGAAGGLAKTQ